MVHELKCWRDPFSAIVQGMKKFEYRKDDRSPRYELGDMLNIFEYNEDMDLFTDRMASCEVKYILRGPEFGIPDGYCIMSIDDIKYIL